MRHPFPAVLAAALAAALAPAPATAQNADDPAGLFTLPDDPGGTAIAGDSADGYDHEGARIIMALRRRYWEFEKAGYPLPDVADLDSYSRSTLIEASQLIENESDPCIAAADVAMFLNARIAETSWRDMLGTVDRPAWMVLKVVGAMKLPDPVGTGTEIMDLVFGLKDKFSLIGTAYNAAQAVDVIKEHWQDTIAVQHGRWAETVYREARTEGWTPEEIGLEIIHLQAQSEELLTGMKILSDNFELHVREENERHAAAEAASEKIYEDRMAAIAEDESKGGERERRAQWLRDNSHTGEPKPGVGVIIDPSRDPSEISHEWWITETEPGGKYYAEERGSAFQELELRRAAEGLRHEATLQKIAYDFERATEEVLTDLSELQVERETLQNMALPVARGTCEEIKPGRVKEKMPEIGMETVLELPHDELMSVLGYLRVKPGEEFMNCVCRRAGYGSDSTTQIYHPDTYGEPDKRYECQQPGLPCIVSGFGCLRHPLPSDPEVWKSCEGPDTPPISQTIAERLNGPAD